MTKDHGNSAALKLELVSEPIEGSREGVERNSLDDSEGVDRRRSDRRKIYREEGVFVRVSTVTGHTEGACLDLSAQGVSLTLSNKDLKGSGIDVDSEVAVEVRTAQGKSGPLFGRVVALSPFEKVGSVPMQLRLRVSLTDERITELNLASLRQGPLVKVPDCFVPLASSGDPLFSTGFIVYRILGFAPGGAHLFSPGRHATLLPGFVIQLRFSLPNSDETTVTAKVLKVETSNEPEGIHVHVAYESMRTCDQASVAEFLLLANKDTSINSLTKAGFFVEGTKNSFRVGYCNTKDEWDAILNLRLQAYQQVGKFKDRKSPVEMQDPFDAFSRQVVCKFGSRVVGCLRIVFVQGDRGRSEHAALGVEVPSWLFDKPFLEVSRACTDTNFRGGDVLPLLFQKCCEVGVQTGNNLVLANCNSDLWPLYKRIGFKKIGVRFTAFGRDDCELILVDTQVLFMGIRTGPFTWNQMFLDAATQIGNNPSEHVKPLQKLFARGMVTIHKSLSKPILSLRRFAKKRRSVKGSRQNAS